MARVEGLFPCFGPIQSWLSSMRRVERHPLEGCENSHLSQPIGSVTMELYFHPYQSHTCSLMNQSAFEITANI